MKSPLTFALSLAGFSVLLSMASLRADDWKTTDGKVYQNVSVVKAEPDAVTILHQDGGARVPLATLPPEIQKKFNYDPTTAKAAADARTQADADNAKALQAEMDQARMQKQAMLVATDPRVQNGSITLTPDSDPTPAETNASAGAPTDSQATAPTDPTHHSTTELVDVTKRLYDDHPDDSHHSIAFLKLVAQYLGPDYSDPAHHSAASLIASMHDLGPDLSDPAHHSMANLAASMHNLGPDPNDPTHHSMSQLFGTDPLSNH